MDGIKTLGVIVPFFNEEKYLMESVKRLIDINLLNQIILVDDCSTDNSLKIAFELSKKYKNIEVVKNLSNTGKGGAVSYALKYISTDYVFVHDADLEYFPTDIVEMFAQTNYNPDALILGSRTIGNKERKKIYFWTYLANKLFALLFSLLNNYKVSDIASCYWLLKADVLKKMDLQEKGFAIEVEVLSKFLKLNRSILEVPIKYNARTYENGKKIKLKDGVIIFTKILKYKS